MMGSMGDCGECGAYAFCECVGPHDDRCMFELQSDPRDRVNVQEANPQPPEHGEESGV